MLSILPKTDEGADRELGAADERHWKVWRYAVAAVKAYDLVAGAAVDARGAISAGLGIPLKSAVFWLWV